MFENLPGFRDFYPDQCAVRNALFATWRECARRFGFVEYDAPLLEPLDLYREKSGDEVVGQLFAFTDKGGREVALRPEMTPSLARLAGARANSLKRPIKWFNVGEHFRYERRQRGRTRSFYQFNADVLGVPGAGADAELIALLISTFQAFGLGAGEVRVRLSDRDLWIHYLAGLGVEGEGAMGVLSVVDKLEREAPEGSAAQLRPVLGDRAEEFLAGVTQLKGLRTPGEMRAFFAGLGLEAGPAAALEARLGDWEELLGRLGAMGLEDFIQVDLGIVRGLAYYTGFVFEAFEASGKGRALAGGGRYDHLVKKLGYPDLPAAGFAMGDVTLTDLLEEEGKTPAVPGGPDVYLVVGEGEQVAGAAHRDAAALRAAGYRVEYALRTASVGKQLKAARSSGARLALVYGSGEQLEGGTLQLRDFGSGDEREVKAGEVVLAVDALLRDGGPGKGIIRKRD